MEEQTEFKSDAEQYPDRLQREMNELKAKYPGLESMMTEIKAANFMSGFEYDYEVEKEHRAYRAVQKFLQSLNNKMINEKAV